jgi:hypothetical protein
MSGRSSSVLALPGWLLQSVSPPLGRSHAASASAHALGARWARAGRIMRDGYAFDTGPTVLTMPTLLEELFTLAGERMSDHLRIMRLDPPIGRCSTKGQSCACGRALTRSPPKFTKSVNVRG